ncbi:HlyD family type I secretion periplasmic adaptor subunit [Alsobacter sp. SYSU M60028]|uniref:Membrane fusion protein (MFP) family protein n=1 Tax=Alsobacter ponti TaxID=2962936 RepID=A0ABT1LCS7_9HYPH|nr:HlyD family type I secretion periplasmic adaptor subunit [Alsobacter ponti]MCP8939315.1 HlyD family type I secretion periplasmic adaptor subunit [Alsobacter ponti]
MSALPFSGPKPRRLQSRPDGAARSATTIIVSVSLLGAFLIGWAALAEVDEVTRGEGKIIPSKKTQTIQSSEPGVVQEILVRLGQQVRQGDLLVRLDSTMTNSNLGEVEAKTRTLQAQIARLKIESEGRAEGGFVCPDELKEQPQICANEANLLSSRYDGLKKRSATLTERVEQRQRELNEAQQNATRFSDGLALAEQELDIITPMAARNIAPKTELLRAQRAVVDLRGQKAANREAIARVEAALREANNALQEENLKFRQDALAELTKASAEYSVLRETMKGAEERVRRTDIRSPVDGLVNTLAVNTVGGFVAAGGHIMDIVPLEDALIVETKVRPADIAFLRTGQQALVKVTAYDFSIYGGLNGVVEHVSPDSVVDDTGREKETFYIVQVRTDHSTLRHNGRDYPIMPGMIAQVDILTGKKTVLDYLLKPIIKAKQEALRER